MHRGPLLEILLIGLAPLRGDIPSQLFHGTDPTGAAIRHEPRRLVVSLAVEVVDAFFSAPVVPWLYSGVTNK